MFNLHFRLKVTFVVDRPEAGMEEVIHNTELKIILS